MSLFDVIRYPISDIPTEEQITNLSPVLRAKLLECLPGTPGHYVAYTPYLLAELFRIFSLSCRLENKDFLRNLVRNIRRMIAEYESI